MRGGDRSLKTYNLKEYEAFEVTPLNRLLRVLDGWYPHHTKKSYENAYKLKEWNRSVERDRQIVLWHDGFAFESKLYKNMIDLGFTMLEQTFEVQDLFGYEVGFRWFCVDWQEWFLGTPWHLVEGCTSNIYDDMNNKAEEYVLVAYDHQHLIQRCLRGQWCLIERERFDKGLNWCVGC